MSHRASLPTLVLSILAALACCPTSALAETRVALVVGNSAYRNAPPLDNPGKDARLMADTLAELGFALIGGGARLDLDKAELDRAVQDFSERIQGADVALFYYAGHGVQVRGANYLVPVGANPTREADVDFQLVDAALVLRQMEGSGTKLNLVILDACRNNPFGGRGLRSADGGLAQMRAPEGTLISYATQPGNVARDGADGHSPYTKALARTVRQAGLDIFQTFNAVGLAVMEATGNEQQPWLSSSPIRGRFYFAGPAAVAATPPTTATSPTVAAAPPVATAPPPAAAAPPPTAAPPPAVVATLPPPAASAPAAGRRYRVLDDVSQGILNMRSGPGTHAPVVVAIPAGASDLTIGRCRPAEDRGPRPWCEARWRGYSGWVSSCCIVEVTAAAQRAFRVLADVSQGILNIRNGPGSRHDLVASIPAGAADVVVGRCRMPDDGGRTAWCEVEWRGKTGWASACCMVDAKTGAHARAGD